MKRYLWGFGFSNLGLEAKSQLSRRQDSTFVSYGDYSSFYKKYYDWKSVITFHTDGTGIFANTIKRLREGPFYILKVPHFHYENLRKNMKILV